MDSALEDVFGQKSIVTLSATDLAAGRNGDLRNASDRLRGLVACQFAAAKTDDVFNINPGRCVFRNDICVSNFPEKTVRLSCNPGSRNVCMPIQYRLHFLRNNL